MSMKGFLINKLTRKIDAVFDSVLGIDNNIPSVTFLDKEKGKGEVSGFDNKYFEIVVVSEYINLGVGDILPPDIVDKKESLFVKSERELIEQLQKENADLMLQLVMKGVL